METHKTFLYSQIHIYQISLQANSGDMNTAVISDNKTSMKTIISDFKQLTKVGLSLSVVFSSVAGYLLAVEIVNFTKKVQGISAGGTINHKSGGKTNTFAAGALVRGVFSSSNFIGQEGNQGPYKLVGPNGELYILIVSATEKVYIDGERLKRGLEFDYIIDYNTSEIRFTSENIITKDKRIFVEFEK